MKIQFRPVNITKWALPLVLAILVGCGGGGTSFSGSKANGRTAAMEAGKGLYVLTQGGTIERYSREGGESQGVTKGAKGILKYTQLSLQGKLPGPSRDGTWYYDPDFDLYYRVVIETDTRVKIEFAETDTGGGGTGFIDVRITNGLPYPIAGTVEFGFNAGSYRLNGRFAVSIADEWMEDFTVRATITSVAPSTKVEYDLHYASGVTTGWLTAKDSVDSIRLSNIREDGTNLTATFVANGVTGGIGMSSSGAGTCYVDAADGRWTLSWDSDYRASVSAPDGSQEDVGYLWQLE